MPFKSRPTPAIIEEFIQAQTARGCYAQTTLDNMRRRLTTFHLDNGETDLIRSPYDSLKTTRNLNAQIAGPKKTAVMAFRDWYGRLEAV